MTTMTRIQRRVQAFAAIAAGTACLAVPAAAHSLSSSEPDYVGEPQAQPAPVPAPDLTVSGTFHVTSDAIHIAVRVRNQGDKPTGPFGIRQVVNHRYWSYLTTGWSDRWLRVDGLAPGATQWLSVTVRGQSCVKLLTIADPSETVAERYEFNNSRWITAERSPGACG